jgi:hypothetical protein
MHFMGSLQKNGTNKESRLQIKKSEGGFQASNLVFERLDKALRRKMRNNY